MKSLLSLLFISAFTLNVNAQNQDSLAFNKIQWQSKIIDKNTTLKQYHITDSSLFNAKQFIAFIEIKPHKKSPSLHIGYEARELVKTSAFGNKYQALAAINGTFFDMKNGGSVDFIKVNGSIISPTVIDKNKRALHQKSAITIHKNLVTIEKWDGTADWETNLTHENVMVTGPLLLFNGMQQKIDSVAFNTNRHPRTALGIKPNGNLILLVVDGRRAESYGLTMYELTNVLKWLGCNNAINLDGGGSTALWVNNYGENGIVNYPSDNKKWDHDGERKVANVLFLKSKGKQ